MHRLACEQLQPLAHMSGDDAPFSLGEGRSSGLLRGDLKRVQLGNEGDVALRLRIAEQPVHVGAFAKEGVIGRAPLQEG